MKRTEKISVLEKMYTERVGAYEYAKLTSKEQQTPYHEAILQSFARDISALKHAIRCCKLVESLINECEKEELL